MKCIGILATVALAVQSATAHYVFRTLIAGSQTSTQAVRQPQSVEPLHDITSPFVTCNENPSPASETITVAPGEKVGFELSTAKYHAGPVAIYLGSAPSTAAEWDGSGPNWFKIAEWGAQSYNPLVFESFQKTEFVTTIPENTPPGEYLVRVEDFGLHLGTGVPEIFVSCGQIKVTGSGTGTPRMVTIPGHIPANDPGVTVNIYNGVTSYKVPGPAVWRG